MQKSNQKAKMGNLVAQREAIAATDLNQTTQETNDIEHKMIKIVCDHYKIDVPKKRMHLQISQAIGHFQKMDPQMPVLQVVFDTSELTRYKELMGQRQLGMTVDSVQEPELFKQLSDPAFYRRGVMIVQKTAQDMLDLFQSFRI